MIPAFSSILSSYILLAQFTYFRDLRACFAGVYGLSLHFAPSGARRTRPWEVSALILMLILVISMISVIGWLALNTKLTLLVSSLAQRFMEYADRVDITP